MPQAEPRVKLESHAFVEFGFEANTKRAPARFDTREGVDSKRLAVYRSRSRY